MQHTAKLFFNGRSQAVRLPIAYRFEAKEVFIRQDPETGDIILSRKPADWSGFLKVLRQEAVPEDFLQTNDRTQNIQNRDPFEGWSE